MKKRKLPTNPRDAYYKRVYQNLCKAVEEYVDEAKEHEDDSVMESRQPVDTRLEDFILYVQNSRQKPATSITPRIDNRDFRTTWLWINNNEYVEVDPVELLYNAVDNLPEEEQDFYRSLVKQVENS